MKKKNTPSGPSLDLQSLDNWVLSGLAFWHCFHLHLSSPPRKQWWITLCRWFLTSQTLTTLWCWWREENWRGRMGMSPLPPPNLTSASWSATCSPPKTWVNRLKGLEGNVICLVEFSLLSFESQIKIAVSDEFGLISLCRGLKSSPECKNGLALVPVSPFMATLNRRKRFFIETNYLKAVRLLCPLLSF